MAVVVGRGVVRCAVISSVSFILNHIRILQNVLTQMSEFAFGASQSGGGGNADIGGGHLNGFFAGLGPDADSGAVDALADLAVKQSVEYWRFLEFLWGLEVPVVAVLADEHLVDVGENWVNDSLHSTISS